MSCIKLTLSVELVKVEAGSGGCWVVAVLVESVIEIPLGGDRPPDRGAIYRRLFLLVQTNHLLYLCCDTSHSVDIR